MKQYYTIDNLTKKRILDLIAACELTELGNVQFGYYESPKLDGVEFYLSKLRNGWQVVVNVKVKGERDVYEIINDQFKHDYSEKD